MDGIDRIIRRSLGLVLAAILTACSASNAETAAEAPPAPQVDVATAISESLSERSIFTGRLAAPHEVDIRPRVSGYIEAVAFDDGSRVAKGELLYRIDPRPYQADVDRLEAELNRQRAQLELSEREFNRAARLKQQNAISAAGVDATESAVKQGKAAIAATQAALDAARLNLEYTRITSPIDGRVSRAQVREGSLVSAGETVLTRVVSTDQVHAYFDIDEQTYLKIGHRTDAAKVFMALADEQGFPHLGRLDFMDSGLNPDTGTIQARAVFANDHGRFTPGLFARVQLVSGDARPAVLIDDRAIGTDLSNRFVYVVNNDFQIEYRPVVLGPKVENLRIVRDGLTAGETIVVNGLQRVRPGVTVDPNPVAMATPEQRQALLARESRLDGPALAERQPPTLASGG